MITIDIQKQSGVKVIQFPDGQPHIRLDPVPSADMRVRVVARIRNPTELLHLLGVSDALWRCRAHRHELFIPYLMGARTDRVMQSGDSVESHIVAALINRCDFERVTILDPHSTASVSEVKNCQTVSNDFLAAHYTTPDAIMIIPDKGAVEKSFNHMRKMPNVFGLVYCEKTRTTDGVVSLNVKSPHLCKGRSCVIIDDICDGGATFNAIADQIEPANLTLIVTHGIFSRGMEELGKRFNRIICSDSYHFPTHIGKISFPNLEYYPSETSLK